MCSRYPHFKVMDGVMRKAKWNNSVAVLCTSYRPFLLRPHPLWQALLLLSSSANPSTSSNTLHFPAARNWTPHMQVSDSSTNGREEWAQNAEPSGEKAWAALWKSPKFLGSIKSYLKRLTWIFILLHYTLLFVLIIIYGSNYSTLNSLWL